jgi:hypothetical protein
MKKLYLIVGTLAMAIVFHIERGRGQVSILFG